MPLLTSEAKKEYLELCNQNTSQINGIPNNHPNVTEGDGLLQLTANKEGAFINFFTVIQLL